MSLINKMLQDLDARGTTRAGGVPPEIKTVGGERRRLPVGRIAAVAGAVVLALGAAAWIVFPLKGKTYDVQPAVPVPPVAVAPAAPAAPVTPVTVVEVAQQTPAPAPVAQPATPVAAAPAPVEPAPVVEAPRRHEPAPKDDVAFAKPAASARPAAPATPVSAPSTSSGTASPTSYAVASARARAEQERLEKRWAAEEMRLATLAPERRAEAERKLREEQARAAERSRQETRWLASLQRKEMMAGGLAAAPAPVAPAAPGIAAQGRSETDTQGAENAYRRALAALQDGRTAEAMAGLQAALRSSPRHEAARQTLVSLLIENNRGDEAMSQLQQALTLDPRQPALAMLLARLQIERGKSGIEALQRTLPYAGGNGEYHAFLAGALQRQNRYHEAAEQYQTALRAVPNNAVWWMGLGMALQGDKRNPEALDAFRQARALGTLSPELQAFVERRLAQVAR